MVMDKFIWFSDYELLLISNLDGYVMLVWDG